MARKARQGTQVRRGIRQHNQGVQRTHGGVLRLGNRTITAWAPDPPRQAKRRRIAAGTRRSSPFPHVAARRTAMFRQGSTDMTGKPATRDRLARYAKVNSGGRVKLHRRGTVRMRGGLGLFNNLHPRGSNGRFIRK